MRKDHYRYFVVLQISTAALFAGRAYQHLFWDAPYREIFWDPFYMQGIIERFTSMSWHEYVTNPNGDIWFQQFIRMKGFFYLICLLVTLLIRRLPAWTRHILWIGALNLVILALIYLKDTFYHAGQFFEYSLQFGSPLFLFYLLRKKVNWERLIIAMKIATLLTFVCHGLYALGVYPRPGLFLGMTINILGVDYEGALLFLNAAGVMDFVVAIGLFLPGKWQKWILVYAVIWGFLTSMARIAGNFYPEYPLESLHQWVFEAVFRFPHFLIPLFLWMYLSEREKEVRSPASPPV